MRKTVLPSIIGVRLILTMDHTSNLEEMSDDHDKLITHSEGVPRHYPPRLGTCISACRASKKRLRA